MDRLGRLTRGPGAAAVVATAFSAARGIVVFPIVTKLLPIAEYGLWAQLGVAATLLSFLALAGTDGAVLRYLTGTRAAEKDRAFSAIALATLLLASVVAVGCVAIALGTSALDVSARAGVAALGMLVVGLVAERIAVTQLRRLLALWSYAAATAAFAAGDVTAIGLALATGLGLPGALLAWGAVKIALAAGVVLYTGLAYRAIARPGGGRVLRLFRFGLPFVGIAMLNWTLNLSDRFLVGWFLGLEAVALYSASYALGGFVALPFAPVFLIVQPLASGMWEDGRREESARVLWRALEWSVWGALPLVLVLALWAPEILTIVARPEYAAAAASAVIVAVAVFVQMLSGFAETEIALVRHSLALTPPFLAAAVTNVVANLVLLPTLGYVGAAIATLLAALVLAGWTHHAARRGPGWVVRTDRIFAAVAAAAIGAGALALGRAYGPALYVPVAIVAASLYVAAALRVMRQPVRPVAP